MQAGGINLFGVVADNIDRSVSIKRTRRTVMPSVLSNRALRIAGATRSERTLSGRRD
jgi:hypothetical protein